MTCTQYHGAACIDQPAAGRRLHLVRSTPSEGCCSLVSDQQQRDDRDDPDGDAQQPRGSGQAIRL